MQYHYSRRGLLLWSPIPVLRFELEDSALPDSHAYQGLDRDSHRGLMRLRCTWTYRLLRSLRSR